MRIYVADDEPVIVGSVKILLERLDPKVEVRCFADGVALLDALEQKRADAVISDIRMPRMDGMTLAQHIYERWTDVQVVLLTGYADFELARSALRCGVVDYLVKPIRYEELRAALERIGQRRQQYERETAQAAEVSGIDEAMRAALAYIDRHYAEQLTLKVMSERYYVNPAYFSEQFARVNRVTFVEYLTGVRMKRARLMLADASGSSVSEIAGAVGYADARYFSTVFRKENGMTPSEYRRAVQEG